MCDSMCPKLRLLFEGGFYSSAAFIQARLYGDGIICNASYSEDWPPLVHFNHPESNRKPAAMQPSLPHTSQL